MVRHILLPILAGVALAGCGHAPPERPNVVLIVIDSLRADALSVFGYARETSPRLDAFARNNLVFDGAVTVAASTAPAMAALMTGRMPYYESGTLWTTRTSYGLHRFFESDTEAGIPLALETLAEVLRREGYSTAGFVTNVHLKRAFQFDQGFDVFEEMLEPRDRGPDALPYGPARELTQRGIEWLVRERDAPFFLYLHYMDVHYPYLPPEKYRQAFEYRRVRGRTDASLQDTWLTEDRLAAPEHRHVAEHMRGLYDAEVRHTDHWIGVLLDELESRGLTDDTLVVVTSDHGEEFLEHGGTLHNGKLYEELVRIPLLMRVPGQGPSRFSASVRNIDVMPTILDFCRAELPLALDAVSLRPLIEGVPASRAPDAIASFPVLPGLEAARMLRTERYKLVHRPDAPERGELYDLLEDPAERRNLHAQRSDLADSLRTRLEAAFAKPARESQQSGFDVRTLQAGAEDQHDEQIVKVLERMSPEERDKLIEAAQQRRRAALHDGIDSESAAQLRAIGYLDD